MSLDIDHGSVFDKPDMVTNFLEYHWTQYAPERHLCPTPEMIEKYIQTCVLCKEERRCGECCVVCPRMTRHMGCEQMISCEYVKDVINSMGLLLDVDQWHEVYKNTVSDSVIQARCKCLSENRPVSVHHISDAMLKAMGIKVKRQDSGSESGMTEGEKEDNQHT